MTTRNAYPLDWPVEVPRTSPHEMQRSRFDVSLARARDDLVHELDLMGASDVILSSNQELRRDGLPYAQQRNLKDAGAVVFWMLDGESFAVPQDRFTDLRGNVRSIGLTIKAMRAIERYGSLSFRKRAFQGFAQLPAQAGADGQRPWRDVLGFPPTAFVTSREIEGVFRVLARERHPDSGGSVGDMAELNRARAEALAE